MFAYIEKDSFLHRLNPTVKLIVIAVYTVVVCLSYFPVLPVLTFFLFFIGTWIFGKIPLPNLLRRMLVFIVVSLVFVTSMLVLRGFADGPDIAYRFWVFKWTSFDVIQSVSLGFRILALVTMSMSFVLTTRPRDLVLSLIQQWHVSVIHGYAAMAAYRFLPELQAHVNAIHLAQEIRGIPWNRGFLSRLSSPFRVMLPLFCVAARRGERVACAMESRGLGRSGKRTFYKETTVTGTDKIFLIAAVGGYAALAVVLAHFDLYRLNFASIQ